MESELGVHIDLYNLEDVKFEGSKYVLTSPRSLEACSRLDVKPIELLYKPLSEFQEELLPQDIPLRTIYTLYDESEQIRQKKLRLCREERSRIMNSADRATSQMATKAFLSRLPSEDITKGTRTAKNVARPTAIKSTGYGCIKRGNYEKRSIEKESFKLHQELLSKKERNPTRSRLAMKSQQASSLNQRKTQRCSSSSAVGTKVKYRSRYASNMSAKLPARDEKILRLMKNRRENDKKELKKSVEAHKIWDTEKKREEALRIIAENKRRELLAEENRIKDLRRMEENDRKAQAEETQREMDKLSIQDSQLKSEIALMNQLRMQELKLSDHIRKETEKKTIQERNKTAKDQQDEEVKQMLLSKQISNISSASERKDVRLHQDSLKKFLDNRQEREQFEQRQNYVKDQEKQNATIMRSSMETRLGQAANNLSQVLEQRHIDMEEKRREDLERLRRARSAHRKLEAEMEAWRYGLLQHKKMVENRAVEMANKSIEMKSWQVRKERMSKQQEQKKNIKKIHKEVERWRKDLERSVLQKEKKVDGLLEEKERSVSETRAMAALSQSLRDDIKQRYISDTFDKKVLGAQLFDSLQRSKSPSVKNRSSIKIC